MTDTTTAQRIAAAWPDAPASAITFLVRALDEAQAAGVTVVVSDTTTVPYPNPDGTISEVVASGFFQDRPTKVLGLSLAGGWERSFAIFVHEFSHFQQWHQNSKVWNDLYAFDQDRDAVTFIDDWLGGKDLPPKTLAACFRATRAVEMDCERRALEHIVQNNLPIDPTVYAQKANAYVHFYHTVEKHRVWRGANDPAPYDDSTIWTRAPAVLTDPEQCPAALGSALEIAYAPSQRPRRMGP